MSTIVSVGGNDFVVLGAALPLVLSTTQIRASAFAHHLTMPKVADYVEFSEQIRSNRVERLFSVSIGGAIRPPTKPTSGFIYPRRLT